MSLDHRPMSVPSSFPEAASIRPPDRWAGASAVGAAVIFTAAFALLGVTFDYPAVLDEDAGVILQRYQDAGLLTYVLWYVMVCASLAFVPVAVLVGRSIAARRPAAEALGNLTTTLGVLAGVLQAVGFARWTFAVPYLADTYADPATNQGRRQAVEVAFEVMHRFVGGALGEHLGFALTAAWTLGTCILLLAVPAAPRLLPVVGLVAATAITTGLAEATGATWPGLFVAGGYTLFAVWLAWLGLLLLRGLPLPHTSREVPTVPGHDGV